METKLEKEIRQALDLEDLKNLAINAGYEFDHVNQYIQYDTECAVVNFGADRLIDLFPWYKDIILAAENDLDQADWITGLLQQ